MSDEGPRDRKPIPLLLWTVLGFVLVMIFMFLLRGANPPGVGVGPPTPAVIAPVAKP